MNRHGRKLPKFSTVHFTADHDMHDSVQGGLMLALRAEQLPFGSVCLSPHSHAIHYSC